MMFRLAFSWVFSLNSVKICKILRLIQVACLRAAVVLGSSSRICCFSLWYVDLEKRDPFQIEVDERSLIEPGNLPASLSRFVSTSYGPRASLKTGYLLANPAPAIAFCHPQWGEYQYRCNDSFREEAIGLSISADFLVMDLSLRPV